MRTIRHSGQQRWYSVAETARMFGVSPNTLYREIEAGQFPAVKIRSRWVIPAKAIDQMENAAIAEQAPIHAADYAPEEVA